MLRAITLLSLLWVGTSVLVTGTSGQSVESRSPIEQITERIRLVEREFELIIRQFSRTVLGLNVHQSQMAANRSPGRSLEERADRAATNTDSAVPSVIPGMGVLSQLTSTVNRNPIVLLQQLFMGILLQFQSVMRTLTSLPGSQVLGR